MLRLEVLGYAGPTTWRWRLTDAGAFVADHPVELDPAEWQFEAFTDLHRYLRWHAAPDRRLAHEAELVSQVGDWITARVLGPVAPALAAARRPVRVEVPAPASALAYRPWELARVDGRPLSGHRVGFVIDHLPRRPVVKAEIGQRLRMLAVFSLPEDASALNLRKERYALARLVNEIAAVNHKAVELRVLQYGATRERLQDALLEREGWDVVHLSGHGLPAGVVLEDDAGRHDLISSTDLVDLLDLASDQIKLVTLSACESAAVTAAEHLHLLGLAPPVRAAVNDVGSLPAVATELVRRLDCAVLAMRYPVVDDFAIALSRSFYDLVLGKGQPVSRALALSLPRVAADPPTPGAPALSAATPTLFGARAEDLRLVPPAGQPLVFQAERQKLAEFPAQPDRFVGRVGPMTRATTALAPRSGRAGVLFHGMAGAGKTACALELAYTHEESFPQMAWHAAPPEGHDIGSALTDFALALERQLSGLKLAHLVGNTDALRAALPGLTEALEQNRVLVVLDNVESLLTERGTWRDERWGLLIDAMIAHRGLSRLVLTSRRRPSGLADSVVVEPVHALSLQESVLLAREWPNLSALIDADHELAARVLEVVQGHPKLLELAEGRAADRESLATRLDEADATWRAQGTRLEPFLRGDDPTASDTAYLAVLDSWTRAAVAALPPESALLFRFLCCLEDVDRVKPVVSSTWPHVWSRSSSEQPPDIDTAMRPLVRQALVALDDEVRYRIHPGVAEAGRTSSSPEFREAVDNTLGDLWLNTLRSSVEQENDQLGGLVRHAARSAGPYLLRTQRWSELSRATQQALERDSSRAAAVALLPALSMAEEATRGTEFELDIRFPLAVVLMSIDPDRAEGLCRELLEISVARENFALALSIAGTLIDLYQNKGEFDRVLALVGVATGYVTRAGLGPWTQLTLDTERLKAMHLLGRSSHVLDLVEKNIATMATLVEQPPGPGESVRPWSVRERTALLGAIVANSLGQWQRALDLNAVVRESERRRGASAGEMAMTRFNDYSGLLGLGRVTEAVELLRECLVVFQSENRVAEVGKTFGALADAESMLHHIDRAVELGKEALRINYAYGDPLTIQTGHTNLGRYFNLSWTTDLAWAHCAAASVIAHQIGSRDLEKLAHPLSVILAEHGEQTGEFDRICALVDEVEGVHLADLVDRLPRRAPDGQQALDEVVRLAERNVAEHISAFVEQWMPVISAMRASRDADPDPVQSADLVFEQTLATSREVPGWQAFASTLHRVRDGERDVPVDDLSPVQAAIVRYAVDVLDGRAEVDPDAWLKFVNSADDQGGES
ncbi:CHAT domain-containing protein [Saccharothrix sp. ALI-22-I]|uniref:CHAT domain-containing protein n=1 Tax=Saccharothrix sp. ALI-22-I TaxID=1933778 RepID=UPI0015C3AB27|nr:CHAT domain-containing protein [Saccharothrix sp. ALI-22-I]